MEPLVISTATRGTAGILLLTIVLVETGGLYMYSIVRKRVVLTSFQQAFARAGHAHAGVLVILSLIVLIYADVAALDGLLGVAARSAVPLAAILMPVGLLPVIDGRGSHRAESPRLAALRGCHLTWRRRQRLRLRIVDELVATTVGGCRRVRNNPASPGFTLKRTIDAPVEAVWNAWADPAYGQTMVGPRRLYGARVPDGFP